MRNSMDYIYTAGDQKILIEAEQNGTRRSVIDQYIRCRKQQGMTQAELAKRAGLPEAILQDSKAAATIRLWNFWYELRLPWGCRCKCSWLQRNEGTVLWVSNPRGRCQMGMQAQGPSIYRNSFP